MWPTSATRPACSGRVIALALALAGCGATTPATPGPRAPREEPLPQAVGQTLMLAFTGLREPAYVARILHARTAAGAILTGENVSSARQVRALDRSLEASAGGRALIGADQEGGAVRTFDFAAAAAGQAEQVGAARAGTEAAAAGRALRDLGLNVDFAPVADVVAGPDSIMRARSFPGGAQDVAAAVGAAVAGYGMGGVAATAKHFPGLGAATANTDSSPVTVADSLASLRSRDLPPFRAAIAAGVPLVMVSHAVYPALDPGRIASQSGLVIDGLLRRTLGFRGVVITDSIEADAVRRRSDVGTAAVRSIEAGADIVLMTGPGSYRPVFARLLATARRSPAFRARIRAAAGLVQALELRLERQDAKLGRR